MKKYVFILLLCLSALICLSVSADQPPRVYVDCNNYCNAGENIGVDVVLENAYDYCGFSYVLKYDSTMFEFVSLSVGDDFISNLTIVNENYGSDMIFMSYPSATPMDTNGLLLSVVFKAKNQTGSTKFEIDSLKVFDENSDLMDFSIGSQKVVVADENTLGLKVSGEASAKAGQEYSVDVILTGNQSYCGFSFILKYDSSKATFISAEASDAFQSPLLQVNTEYADNKVFMSFPSAEAVTTTGSVLKVKFKINDSSSGNMDFEIESFKVYDEQSLPMDAYFVNHKTELYLAEYKINSYNQDNASVLITSPETTSAVVIFIKRGEGDVVSDVVSVPYTLQAGENTVFAQDFDGNINNTQIMLVKSLQSMEPLCECLTAQ